MGTGLILLVYFKKKEEKTFSHVEDESITRCFGFPVFQNDKVEAPEPNHNHNSLLHTRINLLMRIHHSCMLGINSHSYNAEVGALRYLPVKSVKKQRLAMFMVCSRF